MKLSLCNEVPGEMPFPEQCALAASLGYDGIELAPFTLVDDPREMTAKQIAMVRQATADAGITISGLHWLLLTPKGLFITTSNASVWRRSVDVMRDIIEICAELGGDILVHDAVATKTTRGRSGRRGGAGWKLADSWQDFWFDCSKRKEIAICIPAQGGGFGPSQVQKVAG